MPSVCPLHCDLLSKVAQADVIVACIRDVSCLNVAVELCLSSLMMFLSIPQSFQADMWLVDLCQLRPWLLPSCTF